MPPVKIVFYQEKDQDVPALDWLEKPIRKNHPAGYAKCYESIKHLRDHGHETLFKHKTAAYLKEDIYELRINSEKRAYRILFFFDHRIVLLCNALTKREDDRRSFEQALLDAIRFRANYLDNREQHTFFFDLP
jgi:hypothetical protein